MSQDRVQAFLDEPAAGDPFSAFLDNPPDPFETFLDEPREVPFGETAARTAGQVYGSAAPALAVAGAGLPLLPAAGADLVADAAGGIEDTARALLPSPAVPVPPAATAPMRGIADAAGAARERAQGAADKLRALVAPVTDPLFQWADERRRDILDYYGPKPEEEFDTLGQIAGGVAALPVFPTLPAARGQELVDAGVEAGAAQKATLTNTAATAAMAALPASLGGKVLQRAAGGAALNVGSGAAMRASEGAIIEDEAARLGKTEELVQPAFSAEASIPEAVLGAGFGALARGRAAAAPRLPTKDAMDPKLAVALLKPAQNEQGAQVWLAPNGSEFADQAAFATWWSRAGAAAREAVMTLPQAEPAPARAMPALPPPKPIAVTPQGQALPTTGVIEPGPFEVTPPERLRTTDTGAAGPVREFAQGLRQTAPAVDVRELDGGRIAVGGDRAVLTQTLSKLGAVWNQRLSAMIVPAKHVAAARARLGVEPPPARPADLLLPPAAPPVAVKPIPAAAPPSAAPAPAAPFRPGTATRFKAADGEELTANFALVDADALAPTLAKADNQYRDRDRAASDAQIAGIAGRLNYDELHWSPVLDYGAPVVSADGQIISGNGRMAGIRRAYEQGGANDYRAKLLADLPRFGLDPAAAESMAKPVLVRTLPAGADVRRLAALSNEGGSLRMSALEQAKVDAERLGDIGELRASETGDIDLPDNRPYLQRLVAAMPATQRGSMVDADGRLSQEGRTRMRNAVLYRAYGDTEALGRLVESTDGDARNIAAALTRAAPRMAAIRDQIAAGALHPVDIVPDLVQAADAYSRLKAERQSVDAFLAQGDLIGRGYSNETTDILRYMEQNARSAGRVADLLLRYADGLESYGNPRQGGMFGARTPTKGEVLDYAKRNLQERSVSGPGQIREGTGRESYGAAPAARDAAQDAQRGRVSGLGRVAEEAPGEVRQVEAPERPLLESYTEEDLRARGAARERAESAAKAAEDAALRKLDADRGRDAFALTGSKSDADEAAAAGQLRLLEPKSADERAARTLPGGETDSRRISPAAIEAGRRGAAGLPDGKPGQLDLFAAKDAALPSARQARAEVVRLGHKVGLVEVRRFAVGKTRIDSPEDAAHVAAQLRKEAQENLIAIVTDDAGKVLGVVRHTLGQTDSASAELPTLLGGAFSIPGGRRVWMAHNHPSGAPEHSSADLALMGRIRESLRDTGLSFEGSVVVAPGGKASMFHPGTGSAGGYDTSIAPAARSESVGVYERRIVRVTDKERTKIMQPRDVVAETRRLMDAHGSGVLIVDSQSQVAGYLPMTGAEMARLRTGDPDSGAGALLRAVAGVNGRALIVAVPDGADLAAARNVGSFARVNGLQMLDIIADGKSQAETGTRLEDGNTFFSAKLGPDDTLLTVALKQLAEVDDVFRYPRSKAKGMGEIAADVLPGVKVEDLSDLREPDLSGYWQVTMADGNRAWVRENHKGEVWINASFLESGKSQGSALYAIVGDYANNNRKVFIGDPEGLSSDALRRRAEAMLSIALRHGTTDFIAPHEYQVKPPADEDVRPLNWKTGDTTHNLEELALTAYDNVKRALPEIDHVRYDFERGGFYDPRTGEALDDDFFKGLAYDGRGRGVYEDGGTGLAGAASGAGAARAGLRTLKRAAFIASLLPEAGGALRGGEQRGRHAVLARLAQFRDSERLDEPLRELFRTKRNAASGAPLPRAELAKLYGRILGNPWMRQPGRAAPVEVVDTFDGMPQAVKDRASAEGRKPEEIHGVYHDGKVYVVAERIHNRREAEEVLAHELFGHHGIETLFGKDTGRALNELFVRIGGISGLKRIAKDNEIDLSGYEDAIARVNGATDARNRVLMHELLAHLSERGASQKIRQAAKEVIGAIRQALRRMGFAELAKYNDADLTYVLRRARRSAVAGESRGADGIRKTLRIEDEADATPLTEAPLMFNADRSGDEALKLAGTLRERLRDVTGSDLAARAARTFLGKRLTNIESGREATVSGESLKKMLSASAFDQSVSVPAHMMAVGNLDHLFAVATPTLARAGRKVGDAENIAAIHYFEAPLPFRGSVLRARIMAKEFRRPADGTRLYAVQTVEIDAGVVGQDPGMSGQFRRDGEAATSRPPPGASDRFAQLVAAVKGDETKTLFRATRPAGAPAASPLAEETKVQMLDRSIADNLSRLKQGQQYLRDKLGVDISDEQNTYDREKVFYGKVRLALDDLDAQHVQPIFETIKKSGLTAEQVDEYLYARHAQERNEHVARINPGAFQGAGSGMADGEARKILNGVRGTPGGRALDAIAQKVYAMNAERLDLYERSGLVDAATIQTWRAAYKNYVPLKTLDDETPRGTGAGFSIRGAEVQAAFGRGSRATSPLIASIIDSQRAHIRAQKNAVSNSLWRLADDLQNNPVLSAEQKAQAAALIRPVDVADFKKQRMNEATGVVEEVVDHRALFNDPQVIGTKVNGEQKYILVGDALMAEQLRKLTGYGSDAKGLAVELVNAWGTGTRNFGKLLTAYNPSFFVPNGVRDAIQATINATAIEGVDRKRMVKDIVTNLPRATAAIAKSMKRGAEATPMMQMYRQFLEDGGATGFYGLDDLADVQKRMLNHAQIALSASRTPMVGLTQARNMANATGKALASLNEIFENSTRLAVYKAALDQGMSRQKAAVLAKDITVNFNKKGEATPWLSALYVFFNPAVQATKTLLGNTAKSRAFQGVLLGQFLVGMTMEIMGDALAGEDPETGERRLSYRSEFEKDHNVILPLLGSEGGVKIPLPYGTSIPYAAGRRFGAWLLGGQDAVTAVGGVLGNILDSMLPFGGIPEGGSLPARALRYVTPTLLSPIAEIGMNVDQFGAPIAPIYGDEPAEGGKPWSERYFRSAPDSLKAVSAWLNDMTGGDAWESGLVDLSPEHIQHMLKEYTGGPGLIATQLYRMARKAGNEREEIVAGDVPIISRLAYSSGTDERGIARRYRDVVASVRPDFERIRHDADTGMDEARRQAVLTMIGHDRAIEKLYRLRNAHLDLDKDEDAREVMDQIATLQKEALREFNKARAGGQPMQTGMLQ